MRAAGGSSGSCVVPEAATASASRRGAAVGTGRLEAPLVVATLVVLEERLLLSSTGERSSPPNNRPRSACRSAAVVRRGSEELVGVVDADAGLAGEEDGVAKLLGSFRDCCNNACAARAGRFREATTADLLASEALVASEASWRSARTIREAARLRSGMPRRGGDQDLRDGTWKKSVWAFLFNSETRHTEGANNQVSEKLGS